LGVEVTLNKCGSKPVILQINCRLFK
jgi:hypothetical protein